MNKPKAVIYCRVSTKEQVEEGNSLITQERSCRDYALKNGYQVDAVFIEQGESAKSADRTELKKLLSYCTTKKNEIKAVIAYKLDRVSRNTDDYSQIRILLKRYGVEIKSTSEFFEDTPAGRFMENIIANVAQFDNDVRAERSIAGMRQATQEGRYVWMAPLGYSNVKIDGKSTIAPNDKAQGIKQVFEMIASQKYSVEEVRLRAINFGLCQKNGKPLAKSNFYRIIRNDLYMGDIKVFNHVFKGSFQPIISKNLFESVQFIIKARRRKLPYKSKYEDFPLRMIVKHPNGVYLSGCWCQGRTKRYPYYRFNGIKGVFKKEIMEEKFKNFLSSFTISVNNQKKILNQIEHLILEKNSKTFKTEIDSKIQTLLNKRELIVDKSINGVLSDEDVKHALEKISIEISQLEIEREKIQIVVNQNQTLSDALQILKDPCEIFSKGGYDEIRRFLRFVFPSGVIYENESYQTKEICSIFKLKRIFDSMLSQVGSYPDQKNKLPNLVSFYGELNSLLRQTEFELKIYKDGINQFGRNELNSICNN